MIFPRLISSYNDIFLDISIFFRGARKFFFNIFSLIHMSFFSLIRILMYFILTCLVLVVSFIPEGLLIYYLVTTDNDIIHYILSPLYLFLTYCVTVLFFGIVHSQVVVRLTLPYRIKPGKYPHHSAMGQLIAVRITADGIFKSMIKVFTFIPFI